jgi:hypothetical protein
MLWSTAKMTLFQIFALQLFRQPRLLSYLGGKRNVEPAKMSVLWEAVVVETAGRGQILQLIVQISETVDLVDLLVSYNLSVVLVTSILSRQLENALVFLELHVQGGDFGVTELTFHMGCPAMSFSTLRHVIIMKIWAS